VSMSVAAEVSGTFCKWCRSWWNNDHAEFRASCLSWWSIRHWHISILCTMISSGACQLNWSCHRKLSMKRKESLCILPTAWSVYLPASKSKHFN
jgi:hypothetical protein